MKCRSCGLGFQKPCRNKLERNFRRVVWSVKVVLGASVFLVLFLPKAVCEVLLKDIYPVVDGFFYDLFNDLRLRRNWDTEEKYLKGISE